MIEFEGNKLHHKNKWLILPYKILDAIVVNESIFVIYDYMEYDDQKPAGNLVKLDSSGKQLWVAENPTNNRTDAYTNFIRSIATQSDDSILVNNFAGYSCETNVKVGTVLSVRYTK